MLQPANRSPRACALLAATIASRRSHTAHWTSQAGRARKAPTSTARRPLRESHDGLLTWLVDNHRNLGRDDDDDEPRAHQRAPIREEPRAQLRRLVLAQRRRLD